MAFFNFSSKEVKKVNLLIDIGSRSVGGAIYEMLENGGYKILYGARETTTFQKVVTGDSLLNSTVKSLELVLIHLQKYGLEHLSQSNNSTYKVNEASIIITSPWCISETKSISFKPGKQILVSENLINGLIEKEEASFRESLKTGQVNEQDLELIEHKLIEVKLNGYSTANPYGKKAQEIDLKLFTSFAPKRVLERFRSLVFKHFTVHKISFHTFSLACFATIRSIFSGLESFLVVAVGGEVTDLTIAKKGVIAETVSFPFGHNGLLRGLDRVCQNHSKCTLEGLFSLYKEGAGTETDRKRIDKMIAETKESWLGLFNSTISAFSSETFIPHTVFLFEDAPYTNIFEDYLKMAESGQFTVTSEKFDVKTVNDFRSAFSSVGQKNNDDDDILSLEVNFLSKLVER